MVGSERAAPGSRVWARWRALPRPLRTGLWCVAVGAITAPSLNPAHPPSLDSNWSVSLQLAHLQGLDWGGRFAWTYGPLGFLIDPQFFSGRLYAIQVAFAVLVHACLVVTAAALLRRAAAGRAAWMVATCVLLVPNAVLIPVYEAPLVAAVWLYLAVASPGWSGPRARLALGLGAAVIFAAASLVVATAMALALGSLAVVLAASLRAGAGRRVALAALVAYPAALVGLWAVARQPLGSLPGFLHDSAELTLGYSAAMSLDGSQVLTILGGALVAATALPAALDLLRGRTERGALLGVAACVLAVLFKEGFVRAAGTGVTGHVELFIGAALLLCGVAVLELGRLAGGDRATSRAGPRAATAALAGLIGLSLASTTVNAPLLDVPARFAAMRHAVHRLLSAEVRERDLAAFRGAYRAAYPVPADIVEELRRGTVDVAPVDAALADAYGLDADPRPIVQSYAAYTPWLDGRDAAWLRDDRAAARVLLEWVDIDTRYPLFDEPAFARALLEHYQPLSEPSSPAWLVLRRVDHAAEPPVTSEGRACAAAGAPIAVPQRVGRRVYARVDMPLSLRGRLLSLAFHPSVQRITLTTRDGAGHDFRLVGATAADGLFVSGYVQNVADLAAVMRGYVSQPITSITVAAEHGGDYSSQVCVSFESTPSP